MSYKKSRIERQALKLIYDAGEEGRVRLRVSRKK